MSDRDTLADLIDEAFNELVMSTDVAEWLIRRGVRPPARTVTNPAEMDTWPLGTVVRGYGVAHQNVPGHVAGDPPLWIKPTGRLQTSAELLADCRGAGVTVLYTPEEEADCG